MNKQIINKLNLFIIGIKNRFSENYLIFKEITVTYSAGLKQFKGKAIYENQKFQFNFNGKTDFLTLDALFDRICIEAVNYDTLSFLYRERGTDIHITADSKNVKMVNQPVEEISVQDNKKGKDTISHSTGETSTLLNRDYYIKLGKADDLLKEIGILSKEGKIKNDKIRKYNQIDHYVELLEEIIDTLPSNQTIQILDCGCGKSYLTFVLNYYLTEVKKKKCHFIGLDYSSTVIESSKRMAANLGYKNMEFHAVDIKDFKTDKKVHVVISLHACDTATDMALAFGIRVEADVIIAVPCCHRELLNQYSYDPLKNILNKGVFKARFADILTDGMRSLFLEAKGYDVSVVEYISPLETPKNLMIRAIKKANENSEAMSEYLNLMSQFNIYPSLYAFTNEWL